MSGRARGALSLTIGFLLLAAVACESFEDLAGLAEVDELLGRCLTPRKPMILVASGEESTDAYVAPIDHLGDHPEEDSRYLGRVEVGTEVVVARVVLYRSFEHTRVLMVGEAEGRDGEVLDVDLFWLFKPGYRSWLREASSGRGEVGAYSLSDALEAELAVWCPSGPS